MASSDLLHRPGHVETLVGAPPLHHREQARAKCSGGARPPAAWPGRAGRFERSYGKCNRERRRPGRRRSTPASAQAAAGVAVGGMTRRSHTGGLARARHRARSHWMSMTVPPCGAASGGRSPLLWRCDSRRAPCPGTPAGCDLPDTGTLPAMAAAVATEKMHFPACAHPWRNPHGAGRTARQQRPGEEHPWRRSWPCRASSRPSAARVRWTAWISTSGPARSMPCWAATARASPP